MIKRRLILDNAPSNIGEQVHVNHEDCPAGQDKKRRLYIKRTDKGLVAYCHHCCEHGFVIDNDHSRLSTWITGRKPSITASKYEPLLTDKLSVPAYAWLANYDITPSSYFGRFKGVVGDDEKVALKLYNAEGEHFGWQYRNLIQQPKYITSLDDDTSDAAWFLTPGALKETLVITEDYLSAHRVYMDGGTNVHAVALLRTSITDKTLLKIAELDFHMIRVWLDNDDAGLKGSESVIRKLTYFLKNETLLCNCSLFKEPKEYSRAELSAIIKSK